MDDPMVDSAGGQNFMGGTPMQQMLDQMRAAFGQNPATPQQPQPGQPPQPAAPPPQVQSVKAKVSGGGGFKMPQPLTMDQLKGMAFYTPEEAATNQGAIDTMVGNRNAMASKMEDNALSLESLADQARDLQAPKDQMPTIMKNMPFLLALTAIGGSLTRNSGLAMLHATNGMMVGLNKGDEEGYSRAYENYKNEYQKLRNRFNDQKMIYDMLKDAYKERADASDIAAQHTLAMTKDALEGRRWIAGQWNLQEKYLAQMEIAMARLHESEMSMDMKRMNLIEHTTYGFNTVSRGYGTKVSADMNIARMQELLPLIVANYKDPNSNNIILPFDRVGNTLVPYVNDPVLQEFAQHANDLKPLLTSAELSNQMRGNMFIEKIIADTAPKVASMSAQQLTSSLGDAATLMHNSKLIQQQNMQGMQDVLDQLQGPKVMLSDAEYSNQTVNRAPMPGQTATADDLKATMAAHPEMTEQQIRDALKARGITIGGS